MILFCYTRSKLDERVNLKVNSFNSDAGSFHLTGSGLESISCLGKSFSKSGQEPVARWFQESSTATSFREPTLSVQQLVDSDTVDPG